MNELELREFRTRAEELVDLPDLAELESRGRRLHRRRVALGAGLAAAVLAVAGVAVAQRDDPRPGLVDTPDGEPRGVVDYPGPVMEVLDSGTYVLQPSGESDAPRVRITLPEGWNAWEGPNRFDGEVLETNTWYAGLLVVDVWAVSSRLCESPDGSRDEVDGSPAALVAAIERIPGLRVTTTPESDKLFGYPATHLEVRSTRAFRKCGGDNDLLATEQNGFVTGGIDTLSDTWVVNVDGDAFLVDAGYTPTTPPEIQEELYEIVDSIEFVDPE